MKKQITFWMAVIMLFGTITMFAQKPFVGTIVFEMSAEGTDDPNINAQLAMMKQEVTVMGNATKTVLDLGGAGLINLTNGDYNTMTTVVDIPGMGKYYTEKKGESLQTALDKVDCKFDYTNETKVVAGYNCKKVIVTITDKETDETQEIVIWVTEEMMLGDNINFSKYPGLKGFVLCTENKTTDESGTEITIVTMATSITPNKKIKSTNFLRPSDAQPLSEAPQELQDQLKAFLGE